VWLYEYVAGIRPDPEHPGFKHVVIRPYPIQDLTFVKASHKSMYGTVRSNWKRENGHFVLDVSIPANTTATIIVPANNAAKVTESGEPVERAKGVKFVRGENGAVVYEVGSGAYSFLSRQ